MRWLCCGWVQGVLLIIAMMVMKNVVGVLSLVVSMVDTVALDIVERRCLLGVAQSSDDVSLEPKAYWVTTLSI